MTMTKLDFRDKKREKSFEINWFCPTNHFRWSNLNNFLLLCAGPALIRIQNILHQTPEITFWYVEKTRKILVSLWKFFKHLNLFGCLVLSCSPYVMARNRFWSPHRLLSILGWSNNRLRSRKTFRILSPSILQHQEEFHMFWLANHADILVFTLPNTGETP